ncbi:MAG: TIM barrel protein [Candidatus Woesearchaeota archaeon]
MKKPVFVAIEHIFPESYGGHPQELKEIVLGARKEMQRRLEQWGYSKEEAKKKAEDHIKGTLDIGHLNMWRKYWNPKGKNPEENEEEFKKWAVSQVEDLAKDKIWGNVHLTDNFGYGDDHLAPGMGNAPTREIAKVLKKHGYEGPLIVEPGADASVDLSDFHGTMKAWRFFGSPIYGLTAPVHDRMPWESVQYGWFGQTRSPYFIFGAYAPSQEWKLWTEVPLE